MSDGYSMTAYSCTAKRKQQHQCDVMFMLMLMHLDTDAHAPDVSKLQRCNNAFSFCAGDVIPPVGKTSPPAGWRQRAKADPYNAAKMPPAQPRTDSSTTLRVHMHNDIVNENGNHSS